MDDARRKQVWREKSAAKELMHSGENLSRKGGFIFVLAPESIIISTQGQCNYGPGHQGCSENTLRRPSLAHP